MSCECAHYDGSYVLGALSPVERQQFERHLADCAECARAVRELAGMPGLLARVGADALESPSVEPVPETLLPGLVREVRRTQRRRLLVTAAVVAAAAVAAAVGSVALVNEPDTQAAGGRPGASTSVPAGAAMTPLQQERMSAHLAFESVPWGTRLSLTCSYAAAGEYGQPAAATYALFVGTRDGRTEQVATWTALPGRTMSLAAATATHRSDIKSVEVRTTGGTPVLRMTM